MKPMNNKNHKNTPNNIARAALSLSALSALCLCAPAVADDFTTSIGVRAGGVLIRDRGLDPASESDINPQTGLYTDIEVFSPTGPDHLSLGLEWATASTSASLFNSFQIDTNAHYLLLAATYRYDLTPWLAPYVRTSAGVGFHHLSIEGGDYEADDDWTFAGYSGAGAEFIVPYKEWSSTATTTIGVRLELGYTYRAQPEFIATRPTNTPEDEAEIPLSGINLGSMPNNGYVLTFDAFIRF
jgi:hypothetical protein